MTQIRFEFSQIQVTTVSGWYGQNVSTESGLFYRTEYLNTQERGLTDTVEWIIDGEKSPPKSIPFAQLIFQLSNQTNKIKRDYEALVDVFQNIGGFSEILIFIFCYVMIYHHDVLMNLFLLNNSILMNHYNKDLKKAGMNQVSDVRQIKADSKYERKPYTYSELLRLRFFPCCLKKTSRYLKYQEHMEIMA